MPDFGSLDFGSRDWLPLASGLVIVGAICVIISLWRNPIHGWAVWLSAIFKIIGIASIALYLVEPLIRSRRPKPGANAIAIVVDNSRSMSIRAPGQTNSLQDKLKLALRRDASWHARASQDFAVRLYSFDNRLHALDSFEQIDFSGNSSSLGNAIETIRERFADRPTAGILIFTDGMSTDVLPRWNQGEGDLPVFPIVDNGRDQIRDVSITDPTVVQSSFELAPVQIEATIHAQGVKAEKLIVRLIDDKQKTLSEQSVTVDAEPFEKRVRLQYKPSEPGIQFVKLRAMLAGEDRPDDPSPQSPTEITTTNNTRLIAVDRGGGPYRILYVAGRTSWDFKFFKRAVEEDQELRLSALIRVAKKEAKFSFRDRAVNESNPLFEGFDVDQETSEQYDEPTFVKFRDNDSEEDDFQSGFPKSSEVLYRYDAIVLDDVEAKFFTQEQMLLIRQFVATRGGGLIMLGGSESFDRGGYRDTPIGDLLPVYLRSTLAAQKSQSSSEESGQSTVAFRLTREGGLEPWMRLRANEAEEAKRIAEMPRFATWNPMREIKPGASMLGVIGGEEGSTSPAMVTQNFGSGRTAALMIGDMWRWTMRRPREDSDDLAQCWRQIARWLTADVPRRLEIEVIPPVGVNDPHTIAIKLRDENFRPLDNAQLEIKVLPPDGKLIPIDGSPDREQTGVVKANFWSQADGAYVVSVKATDQDGTLVGEAESGWTAEPSANEFRNLTPDLRPLASLAEQSGGEVIDVDNLDSFIASLPTRRVPITETRIEPLWHRSSWLMLTIVCLCAEWGLRRWRGLP